MKNFIFLFIIVTFSSCKSTKDTASKSITIYKDSIRVEKIVERMPAVRDTITITSPCDSTGMLTSFYSKLAFPQGNVIIRSYKGNIQATVNLDSIEKVYQDKYRNKSLDTSKSSKEIITKSYIPKWIIWVLIIESLLIALYVWLRINKFIK